jgi:hypothetical protein
MKVNLSKRAIVIILLVFLIVLNTSVTFAYWESSITAGSSSKSPTITIGEWLEEEPWENEYNLNIWEEEGRLNQYVPQDTVFSYDGNLYIVNSSMNYNPYYHGLPGQTFAQWAFVAVELEWQPNVNYRVNSVVIRNGKWYIANYRYNTGNWFVNDPATHSGNPWAEWREIEPLLMDYFGYLLDTNLLDYRADPNDVTYK